jgi:hypothetical protein
MQNLISCIVGGLIAFIFLRPLLYLIFAAVFLTVFGIGFAIALLCGLIVFLAPVPMMIVRSLRS